MFSSQFKVSLWDWFYLRVLATSVGIIEGLLEPNSMAGDNSLGSGHALDDDQGMEVLWTNLLTQETVLRALADSVDLRF